MATQSPADQSLYALRQQLSLALEALKEVEGALHLVEALQLIDEMGLLAGISALSQSDFFQRLTTAAEQKQNMASYLMEKEPLAGALSDYERDPDDFDFSGEPELIFFESGSTVAYLIGKLAGRIAALRKSNQRDGRSSDIPVKTPFPRGVVTNNFFGVTAFANLVQSVRPTEGTLDLLYFGFFPFAASRPTTYTKDLATRYNWHLERLCGKIRGCRTIYGTSSDFSFLAGPIVGSFQNALFKRAMHATPRNECRLYLLVHFEKLVGLHSPGGSSQMHVPKETCYCVFPPHKKAVELVEASAPQAPVRDSVRADSGYGWHSAWADGTWRNFPISDLWDAMHAHDLDPSRINGMEQPWLQCAQGVRLVIGMPPNIEPALRWLQDEIAHANRVIGRAKLGVRYSEPIVNNELRICEVEVQRR
jgi:hypothetical protein